MSPPPPILTILASFRQGHAMPLKVLSGSGNIPLAEEISGRIGAPLPACLSRIPVMEPSMEQLSR